MYPSHSHAFQPNGKPILDLIKKMKKLSAQLPDTVPEA
jgi:hypothetical protein